MMAPALPFGRPDAPPRSLLRALGFYGLDRIETSVLAALVTGDPCLFFGSHGAAKTSLARALARALGLRFWAYDASKSLFEDLVGFPDPSALSRGAVDYVPTPLSIWDKQFVLVDEISRAAPSMQNKWLEVVRARQVMGRDVTGLRHVFAAMNPPGYLGAHPLDAALAGRFAFVVPFPEAKELEVGELREVIGTVSGDDAPLARAAFARSSDTSRAEGALAAYVEVARKELPAIVARWGAAMRTYVLAFSQIIASKNVALDGRRLAMLWRNLLAVEAVESCRGAAPFDEARVFRTVEHSLPHRAMGETLELAALYPAHVAAHRAAFAGAASSGVVSLRVLLHGDPVSAFDAYRRSVADVTEEDHHEMLNVLVEAHRAAEAPARGALAVTLLRHAAFVAGRREVPAAVVGRALACAGRVGAYSDGLVSSACGVLEHVGDSFDPDSTADALTLRLAAAAVDLPRAALGTHRIFRRDETGGYAELRPPIAAALASASTNAGTP